MIERSDEQNRRDRIVAESEAAVQGLATPQDVADAIMAREDACRSRWGWEVVAYCILGMALGFLAHVVRGAR